MVKVNMAGGSHSDGNDKAAAQPRLIIADLSRKRAQQIFNEGFHVMF